MKFSPGSHVCKIGRSDEFGTIVSGPDLLAGQNWYKVDFGPRGISTVPEEEIRPAVRQRDIRSLLKGSAFGSKEGLSRLLTLKKLTSSLGNSIYSLKASRTIFFPHQFKPVLKFLDSYNQRLLIADEVGLGKTIEAGLILTELKARYTHMQRILIVCPSRLRQKWRTELRTRFNADFRICRKADLLEFLEEYAQDELPTRFMGICSLESLRGRDLLQQWAEIEPLLDMVVIDEAHHMRNTGTLSNQLGRLLSDSTESLLLLSATPVQTKGEDLFRLLQILDSSQFDSAKVFEQQLAANEPILKATSALRATPPDIEACRSAFDTALTGHRRDWFENNPATAVVSKKLQIVDPRNRTEIIDLQRDLEDLNLLGRILNRTKKRDAQEFCAVREAHTVPVAFTEDETAFYHAVTRYVEQRVLIAGKGILAFAAMMPQRQMASSINAMVRYYREHPIQPLAELADNVDWGDFDDMVLDEDAGMQEHLPPDEALMKLVNEWPEDSRDTKAEAFLTMLRGLEEDKANQKVLLFAYFKKTVYYLQELLSSHGVACLTVTGDDKEDDRAERMQKFRNDRKIRVLLCSDVASEGLDFQFCNTIVNFDLPWNPMKIEQRIGRIDRIGQEEDKLRVFNFAVDGTIEEKILNRLHKRIGIFERSIGDLESILGDRIRELTLELMSGRLTEEQQNTRIELAANAIEKNRQEVEVLEENSAKFIGHDEYFQEELKRIRNSGRYVGEAELEVFVRETISARFPRTRLGAAAGDRCYHLRMDSDLAQSLRPFGNMDHDLFEFISRCQNQGGRSVTFSQQWAYENSTVAFLNAVHPFIMALVEMQKSDTADMHPVAEIHLRTNSVPPGRYFFLVWHLQVQAARSSSALQPVLIQETSEDVLPQDISETVLGELVELGTNPPFGATQLSPEIGDRVYALGLEELGRRIERTESWLRDVNEGLAASRLESLQKSYGIKIETKEKLYRKQKRAGKDEWYLRMLRGSINSWKQRLAQREDEIEQQKQLSKKFDEVVGGVLAVTSPS